MWSGGSPTKTNIQEANKHLQALYTRVTDLERALKERDESLLECNAEHRKNLGKVVLAKDAEISDLRYKLGVAETKASRLEKELAEKNEIIQRLQSHKNILDQIVKYKPVLAAITGLLHNSSVVSVKPQKGASQRNVCTNHDSAVSDLSTTDESLSIQQLTEGFARNSRTQHFSINAEDTLDQYDSLDDVFSTIKKEKEYYL